MKAKSLDIVALAKKYERKYENRCPVCLLPEDLRDAARTLRELESRPSYRTISTIMDKEFGRIISPNSLSNHFLGHPKRGH